MAKRTVESQEKNIFVTLWFVPLLYCSDSSLQFFVLYGSSLPITWNKKKFRNGVHRARNIKKLRHLCPPEIIWTSEMPCGSGLWSIKFSSLPPTVPRGNTVWKGTGATVMPAVQSPHTPSASTRLRKMESTLLVLKTYEAKPPNICFARTAKHRLS